MKQFQHKTMKMDFEKSQVNIKKKKLIESHQPNLPGPHASGLGLDRWQVL